jgi:hypothetical protein
MTAIDDIDKKCNLLEVIEGILNEKGVVYDKKRLLCDSKLKAVFVLNRGETIVDIVDGRMAYFEK